MRLQRLRRALLAAACVSSVLLAACGGGSVVSQFTPSRVVAFGDAMTDAGERGTRYTVNDGGNLWSQQVAARYGLSLTARAAGGTSYATGNARITAKPDVAGDAATPTVTEQVTAFLASGAPTANDLVIVQGGISDIVAETQAVIAGTRTSAQAATNIEQAARELAAQVRRLTSAGATHVALVGAYNLGRSPWATATGQGSLLSDLTSRFNTQLLISLVDAGDRVLYLDAALYFNLVTGSPASYGYRDVTSVACSSVDPGPGIGTGAGQVSSALCTSGTITAGVDTGTTVWADRLYFTPGPHAGFGNWAWERLRQRW
ncbi:MAG TPA: SGNH/GDSL hydrolase family protein [Ramlibacter sp.]|nr:SGNH/GDSL hydrolase family protein [Ramlibacter sp.]